MFPKNSLFLSLLVALTLIATPVLACYDQCSHPSNGSHPCKNLLERREWRTFSDMQKKNYIDAVRCLQTHPAQDPVFPEAETRFDEFQAYHIYIADKVHNTGAFLPWHRQYLKSYDLALRSECGYTGPTPYWDWTQDADDASSLTRSPVFDPVTGFGGNGIANTYTLPPDTANTSRIIVSAYTGCVEDGPFSNYTLKLGPGLMRTRHCLTRGIDDSKKKYLNSAAVARCSNMPTFEQFWIELEGEPITSDHRMHDGGHIAVGGDLSNFYSSPGEPLFMLHHANLDRIWWMWQQMKPSRLYEISGRSTTKPPYHNITGDHMLQMGSLGPSVPIWNVMNIHGEGNCYTYL